MRLSVVWILSGLWFATPTQAATLHVGSDDLYPTIQAGIDSAVVGDTLVIAAGTWEENPVIVRKDLVLLGAPGETVVLDAGPNSNRNNSGAVLRTVGSRVKLRNLTLRNGRAPVGAGIFMFSGTVDLRNCRIEDNLFGILAVSGLTNLIIVEDCEFLRNDLGIQGTTATRVVRTRFEGGRLAFLPIGLCELIDVEVTGFGWPGAEGAGALNLSGSGGSLERVHVWNNWSDGGAGGIWMSGGNFTLKDVIVENNTSRNGPAGIGMDLVSSAQLENCIVRNNSATGEIQLGIGGLLVRRSNATVTGCSFTDNQSEDPGGGVSVQMSSNLRLENSEILRNTSLNRAGGLYISEGSATLSNVTIAGNRAPVGGGIMGEPSAILVADQVTIAANITEVGGGIMHLGLPSQVRRSIIAFNGGAEAIFCNANLTLECVDIFGNGKDELCGTDGGGNRFDDPLFCSIEGGNMMDLHLQSGSPVADVAGCGRLGAQPIGCVQTAVQNESWSNLKRMYQ